MTTRIRDYAKTDPKMAILDEFVQWSFNLIPRLRFLLGGIPHFLMTVKTELGWKPAWKTEKHLFSPIVGSRNDASPALTANVFYSSFRESVGSLVFLILRHDLERIQPNAEESFSTGW